MMTLQEQQEAVTKWRRAQELTRQVAVLRDAGVRTTLRDMGEDELAQELAEVTNRIADRADDLYEDEHVERLEQEDDVDTYLDPDAFGMLTLWQQVVGKTPHRVKRAPDGRKFLEAYDPENEREGPWVPVMPVAGNVVCIDAQEFSFEG